MTLDFVLIRQIVEIATDGLWTDIKVLNQLFGTDISLPTHQIDDSVMTLRLLHVNLLKTRCSYCVTGRRSGATAMTGINKSHG